MLAADAGWEYVKLSRRASDFALINVAVLLRGDEKGACVEANVVLGSVAPVPFRMQGVEQMLRGKALNQASVEAAALRNHAWTGRAERCARRRSLPK